MTTAYLPPSSLCAPDQGDYVDQRANGTYTACLRVPAVTSASVVVALQTDLTGVTSAPGPTSRGPASAPTPLSLALSASSTTPGATVGVTGRFAHPTTRSERRATTFATLCWDGCDGLQEQGVAMHWSSPTTFHTTLVAPDAAWLVAGTNRVTVHPLESGRYRVSMQCVVATAGCGREAPRASATIALRAPRPTRCVAGRRCATMTLSAAVARIGDRILVRGWAPVASIIGQPFGYVLSAAPATTTRHYPPLAFSRLPKGGANTESVVLAPTTLRLVRGATWADLGRLREVSSTFSGPSAVAPAANSSRVAWCQSTGVVITHGSTSVRIATTDVAAALRGSGLRGLERAGAPAACATVQLDPRHAASVYAGFASEHGSSIPPEYLAPLYTTNAGATWHTVPIPAGASIESFGGFAVRGSSVAALFDGPGGGAGNSYPAGTSDGLVRTEVTSDGGARWTASTLGCPASGPCVTFGPYPWGNCNMANAPQSLLLGPPGAPPAAGVHWTSSSWVASVDSCFPQQLVVTSTHDLLLLDPSSQYPLQESTTVGRTWSVVALPPLAAANYGPDSVPTSNALVLAPDGSLFAVVTAPSQQSQALYRLAPGASSWCRVPRVFGPSITASGVAGPLRVAGADLAWSQTAYPGGTASVITRHLLALVDARCAH
ncbi:MAG: hypothetical protein ACP5PB_04335 [Acidimicrobiales bacterium]